MCIRDSTNTALTNALKELEADELVQRIQYNEMPLRVEYSLTEKGRDLLPVYVVLYKHPVGHICHSAQIVKIVTDYC